MKLHSESVLKQGKRDHERKFQKRMTDYDNLEDGGHPKKKPRRTGAPQQEYCCACNTMRTMRRSSVKTTKKWDVHLTPIVPCVHVHATLVYLLRAR